MYLPCLKRQKLTIVSADGSKLEIQQCIETRAEVFGKAVSPEVCAACAVRGLAPMAAKREKVEKPKKGQAFVTAPGICLDLKQLVQVKCCGEVLKKDYCQSQESAYNGQQVSKNICASCSVRRVAS